MSGPHAETISWLQRQLAELETWKCDLLGKGACEPRQLEQIDLHRDWLKAQLANLTRPSLTGAS